MIEAVFFPEVSGLAHELVGFAGLGTSPCGGAWGHCFGGLERGQDVDMVRHHHEVSQLVILAVEMPQILSDDLRQLRPTEQTFPVAFIERLIPALADRPFDLLMNRWLQSLQSGSPIAL